MKNKLQFTVLFLATVLIVQTGCKKESNLLQGSQTMSPTAGMRGDGAKKYSSDVAQAWMKMEMKILRTTSGISNLAAVRPCAYSGIVMYESVVPGMPSYQTLVGQLNGLPAMPQVTASSPYHWAESMNAAMSKILKLVYPTMSTANVATVDSLESAFAAQYGTAADAATITRSADFGRGVAQTVYDWSLTDGNAQLANPYTAPTGPGLWVPTPPAFAAPLGAYWGNLRTMVAGSGNGAQPPAPPAYSETPGSDFYNMALQVYNVSQTLTQSQIDQGMYWRDVPGFTTAGHYVSILQQALQQQNSNLEVAASAYALVAMVVYDASISTWQTKYTYNQVRPITYIRNVLGYTTWNSLLTTPNHPEYSSAHASLSSSVATALTHVFGDNFSFTDHSYDYLGFPARSFGSFNAFALDAGSSRLFAGIHYQNSIDKALVQGNTVAQNVINTIVLKKPE